MNLSFLLKHAYKSGSCRIVHDQKYTWRMCYKLKTQNRWVFYALKKMCMPTFYMPEEFLWLKMGLVLCDFHFLVRLYLERLDEVLIGTETMLCTWCSHLQGITVVLNLWFRMMVFVFSYTQHTGLQTLS